MYPNTIHVKYVLDFRNILLPVILMTLKMHFSVFLNFLFLCYHFLKHRDEFHLTAFVETYICISNIYMYVTKMINLSHSKIKKFTCSYITSGIINL